MAKNYEGSKEDMLRDRREARKRKMSVKDYEGSPADMAEDAKHMAGGGKVESTARGMGAALRGGKYCIY